MIDEIQQQRFIDIVKTGAMDNFYMHHSVSPFLLTLHINKNGESELGCLPLAELMADENDVVTGVIQHARMNSSAVAMVAESWLVKKENKPGQDIKLEMSPEDDPDRIEVVNIMFYFGLKSFMTTAEIIRPEHGDPILANWEDYGGRPVRGRFGDPPPSWN